MKNSLAYIKIFLMIAGFVFLAGFANYRHHSKTIQAIQIHYQQNKEFYIDETSVNKLLIQNKKHVKETPLYNLDLNLLETQIESHPMVENAEVYLNIDRILHTEIKQRKPLARVISNTQFYIDYNGEKMPLSENYSARVPIIFGLKDKDIKKAYQLLYFIQQDLFLKQQIIEIETYPQAQFGVSLRNQKFKVFIGKAEKLKQKFMNFKAFYIKAKKDSILNKYKRIDLQYGNQVVCEKFES